MFGTDGFKVLKGLTDAVVQRQGLLSNNLANINSEGYIRKDVDFSRVMGELKSNIPSSDNSNHSTLARATYNDPKEVTLESELSSLYQNHLRYLLLVKGINHHFDHMKKALEVRAS